MYAACNSAFRIVYSGMEVIGFGEAFEIGACIIAGKMGTVGKEPMICRIRKYRDGCAIGHRVRALMKL